MERECVACFVIYRSTHFLANLRGTWQTIQLFIGKLLCCFMKQFFNAGSDQYIKNSPPPHPLQDQHFCLANTE